MKKRFLVVLGLCLLLPHMVHAIEINDIPQQLEEIAKRIKKNELTEKQYKEQNKTIADFRIKINSCITDNEAALVKVKTSLVSLGEASDAEPREVKVKRAELNKEVTGIEKKISSCKLLILKSDELQTKLSERHKEILAQKLFAQSDSVVTIIENNLAEPLVWFDATIKFIRENSGITHFTLASAGIFSLIFFLTGTLLFLLRHRIVALLTKAEKPKTFSENITRASIATYGYYLPHISLSFITALYAYMYTKGLSPVPFVSQMVYGLPVYFTLLATIQLLLAPRKPAHDIFDFSPHIAKAFAARLNVLITLMFIGYLFFKTIVATTLPELVLLLGREIFAVLFIVNLIWLAWLFRALPNASDTLYLRMFVLLALVFILITELAGYRNLSVQAFRVVFGTTFVIGLGLFLQLLLNDLFSGLKNGTQNWHQLVRKLLGLGPKDRFPGLLWMKFLGNIGLWIIMGYLVLRIWGLSDTAIGEIKAYLTNGFAIGSLNIIPFKIFMAIVTLALVLSFNSWFKGWLEKKWLPETRMDRGTREAVVSISGYTGAIIAGLVSLGIAGVEFANLALIAGALSVGIGFGLQNIVNNFISGIILLLERPIKTGDWVVVGGTEGNVKKIRIRSTQIQTFDRADVIVPNSELISGQVTNWMLHDSRGRARIPVGVAYGSDIIKVKEILTQVAMEHPQVIKDDPSRDIQVLFRAFGDSSLDFELRVHIHNIDRRLNVISDINFAIDKAFRENNVEIPFPQRDLHIRSGTLGIREDNPKAD